MARLFTSKILYLPGNKGVGTLWEGVGPKNDEGSSSDPCTRVESPLNRFSRAKSPMARLFPSKILYLPGNKGVGTLWEAL